MKTCGIYSITNIINDKKYIGKTRGKMCARWNQHIRSLNAKKHSNIHLQNAWNKYGSENFIFNTLKECKEENLGKIEGFFIEKYNTVKNGYNIEEPTVEGGKRVNILTKQKLSLYTGIKNSQFGKKRSKEQREKISHTLKGHAVSDITREKISSANKGKIRSNSTREKIVENLKKRSPVSEETKRKLSISNIGKKVSEETKNKISETFKRLEPSKGINNPMFGKVFSLDHRKKLSNAHKGKKLSIETRQKISENMKDRLCLKETREKISKSNSKVFNFMSPNNLPTEIINLKNFENF